jgi:hypothetical protein
MEKGYFVSEMDLTQDRGCESEKEVEAFEQKRDRKLGYIYV